MVSADVGRVISVATASPRSMGSPGVMAASSSSSPATWRLALIPRGGPGRQSSWAPTSTSRRATRSGPRPHRPGPGRPRAVGPDRETRSASRSTARARRVEAAGADRGDRARRDHAERVSEPVQTGILAIDAMIPIGRGQRELIIGDRQTGKTAIMLDTIINQKGKDLFCIYVAIAERRQHRRVRATLEEYGAMEYTTIDRPATASDPARSTTSAPSHRLRHGRVLPDKGQHALVCYDDLTKHAWGVPRAGAGRLRRPRPRGVPGGRVLPALAPAGARGQLSEARGGGSLTALPVIETQANDVSALHPDQRHLDHGRPDLPGGRHLQRRHPAAISVGSRCPGRRRRQIRADEQDLGRMKSDLPGARAGPPSRVRVPPGRGHPPPAGAGPAADPAADPAPVRAGARRRAGLHGLRRHPGLPRQGGWTKVQAWKEGFVRFLGAERQGLIDSLESDRKVGRRRAGTVRGSDRDVQQAVRGRGS